MAASLNKVTLIGNIGKDPEIRSTQTGIKIATITLATSDRWTDRTTGEVKEHTEWHRIVIFGGGLADIAERYLRKGAKIYVEGALQTRKWTDQSGQDRYSTEIALRPYGGTLIMLDGNGAARGASDPGAAQSRDDDHLHDDIPF